MKITFIADILIGHQEITSAQGNKVILPAYMFIAPHHGDLTNTFLINTDT